MFKLFFPIFKIFCFVSLVLLAYIVSPFSLTFLLGGVITQGILGGFSGKVGPVVGAKWKDIDYMKSYVIPANPNTPGQQTQRTRFTTIQEYARQVLSTLIQPYWDPFYSDKSGYNALMSNWLLNADANDLLVAACSASKGTLAPQILTIATYDSVSGDVSISWNQNLVGNQLATDLAKVLVFDKSSGLLYFEDSSDARSTNNTTFTINTGLTATNLECYLFFSQGSGSSMIVSDSDHLTAEAA
jgi:hypothetical protein